MKRILALFLLLVLLPTALPAMAEAEDYPDILTAELWATGSGETLLLNEDGTGKIQEFGETFDGTWTWLADERRVSFSYEISFITAVLPVDDSFKLNTDSDGNYHLDAKSTNFYQNSYLELLEQSAKEKRYYLRWNESAPVDFIDLKLSNAVIYRAKEEPLTKYEWTLNANKNTQYLFAVGTIKNLTDSSLWLYDIGAEFILDGNTRYKAQVATTKDNAQYDYFPASGKEQKLFIYSAIPSSVLKNAKTAELHLSMYDKLSKTPGTAFEGDYFLGLKLSAAKLEAMKKTPAKKKTYYKESTKMPVPTSYVDVMQNGARKSEKSQLTSNKKGYCYNYSAKYSDGNNKSLFNSYVNALKKDGYKIERLKIRNSDNISYKVISGKKWIGTVEYFTLGDFINVYVFK